MLYSMHSVNDILSSVKCIQFESGAITLIRVERGWFLWAQVNDDSFLLLWHLGLMNYFVCLFSNLDTFHNMHIFPHHHLHLEYFAELLRSHDEQHYKYDVLARRLLSGGGSICRSGDQFLTIFWAILVRHICYCCVTKNNSLDTRLLSAQCRFGRGIRPIPLCLLYIAPLCVTLVSSATTLHAKTNCCKTQEMRGAETICA